MTTASNEKLTAHLKAGRVYRRETLLPYSKAIDRDLMTLTENGVLEKLAAGLYYKPATSRFGVLPPKDEELVRCFLRHNRFLLYSWNQYNLLGLGLTQLYNRQVVYNQKRHGVFKLGDKDFDFRRPARGFPNKVTPEFLLTDLVNNLSELAEDVEFVKAQIKRNIHNFNFKKLTQCARDFGKISTQRFLRLSMAKEIFLHQLPDAKQLFEVVARERHLLPAIVEKDYWVMHCLWGIQQQGFRFELKGGTSLSKGFGIIERFSEDIDIQIHPKNDEDVKIRKNQDKPAHITSRQLFFEKITHVLKITDLSFRRDPSFDDKIKMRGAGIRAEYSSCFVNVSGLKEGVVLELGFDQTTPNVPCDITSWVFEKAFSLNLEVIDNRAKQILCYCPEYTFVEKLQTISTKFRLQQENKTMPVNFLRHYYDVYKLLENERVLNFIGSDEYIAHKHRRFRTGDEIAIKNNPAFSIDDKDTRELYSDEFQKKSAIYFGDQPKFEDILYRIKRYKDRL